MIDIDTTKTAARRKYFLRRVNILRFVVPFILFAVVLSYEVWEHIWLDGTFSFDFHLTSEVLFFGIIGPAGVFIVLSYVVRLLREQMASAEELEILNKNLEHMVAERTEELAARNLELAKANDELQKVDMLKSDFVSLVSHELRAPLTTLNGGLELVLHNSEEMSPESRRQLEVMGNESARLTGLVKTILDVSQLEAGRLTFNPGPVAVLPLLERVADVVCSNRDREITWSTSSDLPPLWADEIYVEQIMRNLLTNVRKHTPPNSAIEIGATTEDEFLAISVTDHGPGIPRDQQVQVFERFYRRPESDLATGEGWGLGLYLARALAQAQGGYLDIASPVFDSIAGPGTRFTLTLPVTAEVPDDGKIIAD
jgi:signal transduction histidine kinase